MVFFFLYSIEETKIDHIFRFVAVFTPVGVMRMSLGFEPLCTKKNSVKITLTNNGPIQILHQSKQLSSMFADVGGLIHSIRILITK